MAEAAGEVTQDSLLDGRVRLLQPRRGHRVGSDAVLLAASVAAEAGEVVYDLGAGVGAVGLMVAARAGASVVLVEREPFLVGLAHRNIGLNGFDERVKAVAADILAPAAARRVAGLARESADMVVTNPPFLEEASARVSPSALRAAAHHLPQRGFERWIAAAADLLKPGGRLALIHRADRLDLCLARLGRGFGEIAVRPVHPRAGEPAIRILVTAVKGSRAPPRLVPALVLHAQAGGFTAEAEAVHRGERLLVP